MKTTEIILKEYKQKLFKAIESIDTYNLNKVVMLLWKTYQKNKQIFVCGNGGSAATSSHLACDLGKGTAIKGKKRLRIISLTDNLPLITAWSNDTEYRNCFQEQLVNLLNKGDILIAISTSGNSQNILRAIEYAKSKGAVTIGLVGFNGGSLSKITDAFILIESNEYEVVEDVQLSLAHIIKQCLKDKMLKQR